MRTPRDGVIYGIAAYGLWGLFPLYWPLLEPAGDLEILAHRIVWSLVVVFVLLTVSGGLPTLRTLSLRTYGLLAAGALVITVNWGTYIWGVNNGHVVETSLGYFINPLITVLLGVVVLGERLRRWQWAAAGIAALAVAVLTVDYGRPPWIALTLAISFGTYGLIKKKASVGAVESLAVETAVLFIPACGFLVALEIGGSGTFGHVAWDTNLLLIGAGVVTAIPLLFFGAAAIRVPLTTLGLLQYLAPIIQFALGVTVFREDVPPVRLVGFAMVWAALVVFTIEAVRHRRTELRRLAAEPVVGLSRSVGTA
ncbi:MAG: EamA family transporter RarD [Jiangellaceae bacterium]